MTATPALDPLTAGLGEIFLVVGVLVLLFGAKKLPMLARGLGQGIRNFKGELKDPDRDDPKRR